VDAGRRRLNFSEWNASTRGGGQAADDLQSGRMPPVYYGWLHPDWVLTADEKQALIQGLTATFGRESEGGDGGDRRRGD
jgi:Haem-binding domain